MLRAFLGRFRAGLLPVIILSGALLASAQQCAPTQPLPAPGSWSVTLSPDGTTTTINTAPSFFPPGDSSGPNPTNLLPTIYLNACDSKGRPIPNTLSSSPEHPYNLHPDPVVTPLADRTSPTDDLAAIIAGLRKPDHDSDRNSDQEHKVDIDQVQFAIDILEGNPVNRAYSGFPLLHYKGPNKTKMVTPILQNGVVVGGTLTIHQVWYDTHIESDTAYVDPTVVNDVPWTIHYVVDVLNRGYDDFAGYIMYFDDPKNFTPPKLLPNVGMDNTFFPMADGHRYEYDIKMAPARFWNLSYHWGWRKHPPRVQVTENVNIKIGGRPRNAIEFDAFCPNNRQANFTCPALESNPAVKLAAINMIGDIAPAKRMWNDFQAIKVGAKGRDLKDIADDLDSAFDDWQHRTRLPAGVPEDPNADETLLFVNDTMYGHIKGFTRDMQMEMFKYKKRGDQVKVNLLNGDYFPHAYMLVDFGGMRGWENTFHNTLPIGGQGPLFTFGRNHWWINTTTGPIPVPIAKRPASNPGPVVSIESLQDNNDPDTPDWHRIWDRKPAALTTLQGNLGQHTVIVNFNYDPPARLRMYQFDGFHHDVGIWSPH
ncbi:MAG TPA: hypothetical protein VNW97_22320 [Candidatus Saccharimonadales bacterium]|jgi:hypothetical protein|nr:hypothetical protein [Candidatus Saccharimonadales bacterium]